MELTVKLIHTNIEKYIDKEVTLRGFVKQNRFNGKIGFISFNDGTSFKPIQIVYKNDEVSNSNEVANFRTLSAIEVCGVIKSTPTAQQPFELVAKNITLLKDNDESCPLQNKKQTVEFLRDIAHLRPRTNLFSAVMRARSELAFAIHKFFHELNFVWTATPLITSNDGEGAGETFFLTTNEKDQFFGEQVNLTVTGQLHGEAYAQAFRNIYTFGPTFRAEKSHTARHAAEFWMIEPEMAFSNLEELMQLEESMIKYIVKYYSESCADEIKFLNDEVDNNLVDRIKQLIEKPFIRMSYEEGIEKLLEAVKNGHNFEDNDIHFGMDLGSEHERYLCEEVCKSPVILYNYPKEIKSFYMLQNSDGKTVQGTDVLVPGIGELMGGSVREASYDKLLARCQELNMNLEPLNWYLNLRKYGYYSSAGFGLGFERLVMYLTGITNIRDAIPFPRTHGSISF